MDKFNQYKRTQIAEMRLVTQEDIDIFKANKEIPISKLHKVSISSADLENGSPKIGDMIARNPKDYSDQWLVAEQYFKDNFE
jgi:hypothetical protein